MQCFSILEDEINDISLKEQLTLCVQFVSDTGKDIYLREVFLKYIEIHSLTGQNIATSIINGTFLITIVGIYVCIFYLQLL